MAADLNTFSHVSWMPTLRGETAGLTIVLIFFQIAKCRLHNWTCINLIRQLTVVDFLSLWRNPLAHHNSTLNCGAITNL